MAKTQQDLINSAKRNITRAVAELAKPVNSESNEGVLLLARVNAAIVYLDAAEKLLLSANSLEWFFRGENGPRRRNHTVWKRFARHS